MLTRSTCSIGMEQIEQLETHGQVDLERRQPLSNAAQTILLRDWYQVTASEAPHAHAVHLYIYTKYK